MFSIRSCQSEREQRIKSQEVHEANVRAVKDKAHERKVVASNAYSRDLILKDSVISGLLDSLDIKDRQVKNLKRMSFRKQTEKLVTVYDTLYEFIEVNPVMPTKVSVKHDNCLTIGLEFTPRGLKTTAKRNLDIIDINYYKRRPLFGWTWTPRIGRKQYYQTIVTSCGDTITNNEKIIFEKE